MYTNEQLYSGSRKIYEQIVDEIENVIVGQKNIVEQILIGMLTSSHVLVEGYPGLGKTLLVSTIARVMDLKFSRIQNTPDLVPSDILGTYVIEEEGGKKQFRFRKGPIFANIILSDEINRATPKTQSALLEAMQEKQITVGNETYKLDIPFFVLATQNPIEMEGTYPLPEAQVDRFLLKIMIEYPKGKDEEEIVKRYVGENVPIARKMIDREQILGLQNLVRQMPVSNDIISYAVRIVDATRPDGDQKCAKKYIEYGASPRASIGLVLAAKGRALITGRNYVSKEDIITMAYPTLRHRIILNFESERKGIRADDVIKEIIEETKK